MRAVTRRVAQALAFGLSVGLILLAAGPEFVQRPVGVTYLVLWAALGLATAVFRRPGAPSRHDRSQIVWRSVLGIVGFIVILFVGPWEYVHMTGPLPRDGLLAWIGLGLFAVGILVNAWAMATLRSLYTVRLSVQEDHRLVTTGPYRLVRHPGYSGFLLAFPGMGLALGSLALLGFTVVIVGWLVERMGQEEAMLVERFGDAYRGYQRRTKRLIPFVY